MAALCTLNVGKQEKPIANDSIVHREYIIQGVWNL